jgi:hypothetical protein
MDAVAQAKFLTYLSQNSYTDLKPIQDGARYAGLFQFMFTWAIIIGKMGDHFTYEDRWCYHDYEKAKAGLDAWDGAEGTEPTGWHRHPTTGRRVDEETGEEYVSR